MKACLDHIDCPCPPECACLTTGAYLTEHHTFKCFEPLPVHVLAIIPTIPEGVEHGISLSTGEEGIIVNVGGKVYACFGESVVAAKGTCVEVVLEDVSVGCQSIPAPPNTGNVVHSYEYNFKRVNPCE